MRELREPTSYVVIGTNQYCKYCGEPMKTDYTYEEYEKMETTFCDCEGANLEVEANKILERANANINNKKLDKLRFEYELQFLKHKYGIK